MTLSSREKTINLILETIAPDTLVIACNGKIGRELFELRTQRGEPHNDFILVGAMGCALPLAIGVARNTKKKVVCLVGDGNFLMKLGSFATFRDLLPRNLTVYLINNDCHDSTGGQPTAFSAIKGILPYNNNFRIVQVLPGAREDLGRPTISAPQIKDNFMKKVRQ